MFKLMKLIPKKIKFFYLLGSFFVLIAVLLNLVLPNIISEFIRLIFEDDISKKISLQFFNGKLTFPEAPIPVLRNWLIVAVIVETILNMIFSFTSTIIIVYAAERTSQYYRGILFDKIQKLSLKNIADLKPESLITRVSNDVALFWEFLVNGTTILVRSILMIFGGCVLAILVDPKMSLWVLAIVPIITIAIAIISIKANPLLKKTQKIVEELTKNINENIVGIRVLKTYNLEEERKEKLNTVNKRWEKTQIKANVLFTLVWPIFFSSISFLTIGIYSVAASDVIKNPGQISISLNVNLNVFIDYLYTISFGILLLVMFLASLLRAKVSASRINEVLQAKVDDIYVQDGTKELASYDLKVKNLNFKYYDNSPNYVLKNINIDLPYGKTLGIIGPTGSGKSTLANLLINNYLYSDGSIQLGQSELKEINTKKMHDSLGIVYQDSLLYSGTIKSNMLWAKKDASESEINEALKNACAYEFVNSFDDKLEHPIIQGAKNLSGGQKQRISIARTLLRKPKILILDDSTSALDNITAKKIIENIKNNYHCSTIVVSQKISSIKNADEILVMNNGEIASHGTHAELVKNSEFYRQIYLNQLEQ